MIDKKDMLEFHKSSLENQKQLAIKEAAKKEELVKKDRAFYSKYYSALDERAAKEMEHNNLISSARNSALSTCLKAIYISALEANTLSDEGVLLAERLVDNYIEEKGGAEKIFNECADRSYLLSRLSMIVEDSAKEETKEIEKIDVDSLGEDDDTTDNEVDEEDDEKDLDNASGKSEDEDDNVDSKLDDDKKEDDKSDEDDSKEEDTEDKDSDDEESESDENLRTAGTTDDDTDDSGEDDDDVDSKLDDEDEKSDDLEDDEDVDSKLDSDDEGSEDAAPEEDEGAESEDNEEDVIIDNDDDNGSKDASVNTTDDEGKTSSKLYDELEDEEDVQKAVELIRNRVADAEEAFIKRNAEDKATMNNLLNKISDNVKTVEKIADNDSTKSKIAQENVQAAHRQIGELHNKPQSIFEAMVRNLTSSIVKDDTLKVNYLNESGSIDVTSIIESAKVMYGFLETLNTLQLEKVDGEYIKKALEQI